MQQYFLSDSNLNVKVGQEITLNPNDSHHLLTVLRARKGFKIILVYRGDKYEGELASYSNDKACFLILEKLAADLNQTELPVEVTIACGLSKNDKIDYIVQKATETGMCSFQPLSLARDVVKWDQKKATTKVSRLQKISQGAAEQSKRLKVPEIQALFNLTDFCEQYLDFEHKWVAYEEVAKKGSHTQLVRSLEQVRPGDRIVIVFGSEGGLTEAEVDQLNEHGFLSCSLGPRILRAETAPIYALSIISYTTELMNFT